MARLIRLADSTNKHAFYCIPGMPDLDPQIVANQAPDAQWLFEDEHGQIVARCSLWWTHTPPHGAHRLGLIGHYAARDDAAATQLLQFACEELATRNCTLAVGPMDGNTWQRYRFLTDRGTEPIFFLEPDNSAEWPAHFTSADFTPLAQYYSALSNDLTPDPRMAEIGRKLTASGITIRPLQIERFEEELRRIHGLSLASFSENFLYTPIGVEEFVAQYRAVRPYVLPELVLIAEKDGQPIGYLFTIPDLFQKKRGQPIDTVIVKTLAVHPGFAGQGLGGFLMARSQEIARDLGFRRAIHALMHEGNKSRKISRHTATIMRRYTLFAKSLGRQL